MIIDNTYFVREVNLAQLGDPSVNDNLELFIKKYESKFLDEFFGVVLGDLVKDHKTTPDARFEPVYDGAIIEVKGVDQRWLGLVNDQKISPLANYVFFHYVNDQISWQTGLGERAPKGENSKQVDPIDRLVLVWNEMVDVLVPLIELMGNGDYPEYKPIKKFEKINRFGI